MASIRLARGDDLVGLQEIERRAGEAFRDIGMAAIAGVDRFVCLSKELTGTIHAGGTHAFI